MTRLSDLASGALADLLEIGGDRSFRRRLMELGLLPGTSLRIVRCCDLVELEVRGCHVSLRRADAQALVVRATV